MTRVVLVTLLAAVAPVQLQVKTERDGGVTVFCRESHQLTPEHYRNIGQQRGVKTLTLYYKCSLTDETLALLAELDQVEKVGIDGANFTDDGMKHMAGWKNLRQLTFFHVLNKDRFTGAGVAHLAQLPKLESFGCGGSSFTDAGMAACARLPHLTDLPTIPTCRRGSRMLHGLANRLYSSAGWALGGATDLPVALPSRQHDFGSVRPERDA